MQRNDPCWCGSGVKWKKCHYPQPNPQPTTSPLPPGVRSLEELRKIYRSQFGIILKTPEQIAGIRRAAKLAADTLEATCALAREGVTTGELNDFAHKYLTDANAKPCPLGYGNPPYPKSICTSLNEVICHGIPGKTTLKHGDFLNIDIACFLDGYVGDCGCMVEIGEVDSEKRRVADTAYECLMRPISILKPGVAIREIGTIISDYAEAHGCSVVYQFVGHGVGLKMHEPPSVGHSRNNNNIKLVPGMVFTIEPMINGGAPDAVVDEKDGWTARTIDGKPSAQFEHMLLITETGCEILTPWKRPAPR